MYVNFPKLIQIFETIVGAFFVVGLVWIFYVLPHSHLVH
jgi:hypothetical protein